MCVLLTVRLGSTNTSRLWKLLKQPNPLGMTNKVISVIEMTHVYGARWSFYPLRPKKLDQTASTKCTGPDLGKWAVPKGRNFIHEVVVIGRVSGLF